MVRAADFGRVSNHEDAVSTKPPSFETALQKRGSSG